MSEDVVYTDVKFAKKGGKKAPSSSDQEDVTYSEVRKGTPNPTKANSPQDNDVTYSMVTIAPAPRKSRGTNSEKEEETTYAEVQRGSQHNKSSPEKSKVKIRVAIGILFAVLVLAIIGIAIGLQITERTGALKTTSNLTTTVTTPTTTSTCPFKYDCDPSWELNGAKCYQFSTNKLSWTNSQMHCQKQKGNLVKIESREEQGFLFYKVKGLISNDDKFWIGLTDNVKEGEWKWTDGTLLNQSLAFWFQNRNQKEPDNWTENSTYPEGEDCVRMGETGLAFVEKCWFDQHCRNEQRFICEKKPNRIPDCQQK